MSFKPLKKQMCFFGCGRYIKKSNGRFCTRCGMIYRDLKKRKTYKDSKPEDLYSLVAKIAEERRQKIYENQNFS